MLSSLDLFSGIGGFSLGLERAGLCRAQQFVELDEACRRVLSKRWPGVPIHEDIRTYNCNQHFDVICGGFPCQDLSKNGKRRGLDGERSGLWKEFHRLIQQGRPQWVIVENVPTLRSAGLKQVLADLAQVGYHARWDCIPACAVGADHERDRIWIVANPSRQRVEGLWPSGFVVPPALDQATVFDRSGDGVWKVEPDLRRTSYGLSTRLDGRLNSWKDRLKQLGNSVHPGVVQAIGQEILRVHTSTKEPT